VIYYTVGPIYCAVLCGSLFGVIVTSCDYQFDFSKGVLLLLLLFFFYFFYTLGINDPEGFEKKS